MMTTRGLVLGVCLVAAQNVAAKEFKEYCAEPEPKAPNAEIAARVVEKISDLRRAHNLAPIEIVPVLNVVAQKYTCETANNLTRWTQDIDKWVDAMANSPAYVLPTTCYLGIWVYTLTTESMTLLTGQAIWADCNLEV